MKKGLFVLFVFVCTNAFSQSGIVSTIDIAHFWTAYDSLQKVSDTTLQKRIIREMYMDKASIGLKQFIEAREHSPEKHLKNLQKAPAFWKSIRPATEAVIKDSAAFLLQMKRFKEIYPAFKAPDIYFTIGVLNSGGTTGPSTILIGSEIGCATAATDAHELNKWLQNVFKDMQGVSFLVAHEMVHTQQKYGNATNLLGKCIKEGSCDFIAELITNQKPSAPYITYGFQHQMELWEKLQKEFDLKTNEDWLYNGNNAPNGVADLGYFMGYVISKSYYLNASDKKQAIKDILELKYTNSKKLEAFMKASNYRGDLQNH
ncbi:MAG: hypothetical protein K2P88_10325 [Chitinophagaceae bacterium]|nr:hypothetical protein [Chitinophagaceae bacterium]